MESGENAMKEKCILACDPSLTAWGFVVMTWDGEVMPWRGCIQTAKSPKKVNMRAGDDLVRRVSEINRRLLEVMNTVDVKMIVSELPHGSQSAAGARMIGAVVGILQTISDVERIPLEWYSERDAKVSAGLKPSASKEEVVTNIRHRYNLRFDYSTNSERKIAEAQSDAMLIYHCARVHSPFLKHLFV